MHININFSKVYLAFTFLHSKCAWNKEEFIVHFLINYAKHLMNSFICNPIHTRIYCKRKFSPHLFVQFIFKSLYWCVVFLRKISYFIVTFKNFICCSTGWDKSLSVRQLKKKFPIFLSHPVLNHEWVSCVYFARSQKIVIPCILRVRSLSVWCYENANIIIF